MLLHITHMITERVDNSIGMGSPGVHPAIIKRIPIRQLTDGMTQLLRLMTLAADNEILESKSDPLYNIYCLAIDIFTLKTLVE